MLPTGRHATASATGTPAYKLNLPVSKQFGDLYVHANAGYTWLPDGSARTHVAGSGIWRVAPMLNLTVRSAWSSIRASRVTVSPGFRRGWNFGERHTA